MRCCIVMHMIKTFFLLSLLSIFNPKALAMTTKETQNNQLEQVYFVSRSSTYDEFSFSAIESQIFMKLNAILAPKLNFNSYKSNFSRTLKLIATEMDHCSYNVLKNDEREQQMIFSVYPSSIYPQRQALFIDEKFKTLPPTVAIKALIKEYKVGLIPSYYGESLTEVEKRNPNLIFISGIENHSQLVHMLVKKRLDFIIEYHTTASRELNDPNVLLYSRNIHDVGAYQAGFFACSRSDLGQRVIALINEAFTTEPFKNLIRTLHLELLNQQQTEEVFFIYERDFNLNMTATKPSQ